MGPLLALVVEDALYHRKNCAEHLPEAHNSVLGPPPPVFPLWESAASMRKRSPHRVASSSKPFYPNHQWLCALLPLICLQEGQTVHEGYLVINLKITCTDSIIIYYISCTKQSGACAKMNPQYLSERVKSAKEQCIRHIDTTTNHNQTDPSLPMGIHFQLPGHSHADLQFLTIKKVQSKDPHVRRVREMFYIKKFEIFRCTTNTIERGLNIYN